MNGLALGRAPEDLRGDREVVLAAVRQEGRALEFASEALRADREVVLEAVRQNGFALAHAAPALRGERVVVQAAARQNGDALQFAAECQEAPCSSWAHAFKPPSPRSAAAARNCVVPVGNSALLAKAVAKPWVRATGKRPLKQHDLRLGNAPPKPWGEELRGPSGHAHRELLLEPIGESGKTFARTVVSHRGLDLERLSLELRGDRSVVLAAVRADGRALEYAASSLQDDREVALAAVQQNGTALKHASAMLRGDRAIVRAAVAQDGRALRFASERLRCDQEFLLSVHTGQKARDS